MSGIIFLMPKAIVSMNGQISFLLTDKNPAVADMDVQRQKIVLQYLRVGY